MILSHDTKARPSEHHNIRIGTYITCLILVDGDNYNITCVRAIGDTVNTPYNILIDGGIAPMKTTRKSRVSDRAVCKHTRRKAARGRIKCSTIIIIILYYNVCMTFPRPYTYYYTHAHARGQRVGRCSVKCFSTFVYGNKMKLCPPCVCV